MSDLIQWQQRRVQASITKVSGTTIYSIADVMSNANGDILTFKDCISENAKGFIIEAAFMHSSANQSTKPAIRLMLFSALLTSAQTDNGVVVLTDAEALTCIGYIDFPAADSVALSPGAAAAGNVINQQLNLNRYFGIKGNRDKLTGTNLYGLPVWLNAYTPVTLEQFDFFLEILENP